MRLEAGGVVLTDRSRTTGGTVGDEGTVRTASGGSGEGVELAAPPRERAHPVDSEDGDRSPGAAVHGEEAALFDVAVLHGDLVGQIRCAGELDPAPVLVGPEVRWTRLSDQGAPAQERGDGSGGPLQGGGPVLD